MVDSWFETQWQSFIDSNYALIVISWLAALLLVILLSLSFVGCFTCLCGSCFLRLKRRQKAQKRRFDSLLAKLRKQQARDVLFFNLDGSQAYPIEGELDSPASTPLQDQLSQNKKLSETNQSTSLLHSSTSLGLETGTNSKGPTVKKQQTRNVKKSPGIFQKSTRKSQQMASLLPPWVTDSSQSITLLNMKQIQKENRERYLRIHQEKRQSRHQHQLGSSPHGGDLQQSSLLSFIDATTPTTTTISDWTPLSPGRASLPQPELNHEKHNSFSQLPLHIQIPSSSTGNDPFSPTQPSPSGLFFPQSNYALQSMDYLQGDDTSAAELTLTININRRLRRLYSMNSRILFYEALNHTHGKLPFPTHLPRGNICIVALLIDSIDALWEKQDTQIMMQSLNLFVDLLVHEMNRFGANMIQLKGDVFYLAFEETFDALQFCMSMQEQLLRIPWSHEFLQASTELKPEFDSPNGADRNLLFRGIRLKSCIDLCDITQVERDVQHQRDIYPQSTLGRITQLLLNFTSGGDVLVTDHCLNHIKNSIQFCEERKSSGLYVEERKFVGPALGDFMSTNNNAQSSSVSPQSQEQYSAWLILPKSLKGRASLGANTRHISAAVGDEEASIKSIDLKFQQAELEDLIRDLKKMYIQKVGMLNIGGIDHFALRSQSQKRNQEQQTAASSNEEELLRLQRQAALLETELQTYTRESNPVHNQRNPLWKPDLDSSSTLFFVQIDIPNVRLLWEECEDRGMVEQFSNAIQQYFSCLSEILHRFEGYQLMIEESAFYGCFASVQNATEFLLTVQMELLDLDWDEKLLELIAQMQVEHRKGEVVFRGLRARGALLVGKTKHLVLTSSSTLEEPIVESDGMQPSQYSFQLGKSMHDQLHDLITYSIGGETAVSVETYAHLQEFDMDKDFTHGVYSIQEEDGELWFIVPRVLSSRITKQTTNTVTVVENEKSLEDLLEDLQRRIKKLENPIDKLEKQLDKWREKCLQVEEKLAAYETHKQEVKQIAAAQNTDIIYRMQKEIQVNTSPVKVDEDSEKSSAAADDRSIFVLQDTLSNQKKTMEYLSDEVKEKTAQIEHLEAEKKGLMSGLESKDRLLKERLSQATSLVRKENREKMDHLTSQITKLQQELKQTNQKQPTHTIDRDIQTDTKLESSHTAPVEEEEDFSAPPVVVDQKKKLKVQRTQLGHVHAAMPPTTSTPRSIVSTAEQNNTSSSTKAAALNKHNRVGALSVDSNLMPVPPSTPSQSPFLYFDLPSQSVAAQQLPKSSSTSTPTNVAPSPTTTIHSAKSGLAPSDLFSGFKRARSLKAVMALWNVFLVHLTDLPRGRSKYPQWDYNLLSKSGSLIFAGDEFKYISDSQLHCHSYERWLHQFFVGAPGTRMPSQPLLNHGLAVFQPSLLPYASAQSSNPRLKRDARSVVAWWHCIEDQGHIWSNLIQEERERCLQSFSYPLHLSRHSVLQGLAESLFASCLLYLDTYTLYRLSRTCRSFRRQVLRLLDICCVGLLEPFDSIEHDNTNWKQGRYSIVSHK